MSDRTRKTCKDRKHCDTYVGERGGEIHYCLVYSRYISLSDKTCSNFKQKNQESSGNR